MEKKFEDMIQDIHEALVGNDYNDRGLIKRVDIVEGKVDKHDILIKTVIGVGVLLGFIIGFWNDITKLFS